MENLKKEEEPREESSHCKATLQLFQPNLLLSLFGWKIPIKATCRSFYDVGAPYCPNHPANVQKQGTKAPNGGLLATNTCTRPVLR